MDGRGMKGSTFENLENLKNLIVSKNPQFFGHHSASE